MQRAVMSQGNSLRFFELLKNEKLTNVTLTAEGKMIQAHRIVLAANSSYFEVNKRNQFVVSLVIKSHL